MTLLSSYSSYSDTSHIRKIVRRIGRGLFRLINEWIAAIIAQREHQAALAALRILDDRQLRDMGLDRGQIGSALADAAKYRALRQSENFPNRRRQGCRG
jgi:uncharacterized protein YjiS (DUF1127 family)